MGKGWVLGIGTATMVLSGCNLTQRNCTLIGCVESFQISWSKPLPGFTAEVAIAGDTLTVDCKDPQVECGDTSFTVQKGFGRTKPATASLKLTGADGRVAFEGPVNLAWTGDFYPNGRECDRYPCQSAKASIILKD